MSSVEPGARVPQRAVCVAESSERFAIAVTVDSKCISLGNREGIGKALDLEPECLHFDATSVIHCYVTFRKLFNFSDSWFTICKLLI